MNHVQEQAEILFLSLAFETIIAYVVREVHLSKALRKRHLRDWSGIRFTTSDEK